ncbi:MAG: aminotransferase class III-fold pyridoxal phosphate-dependent enzyme [Deltaproteobacteria bacterium]|nr:aminotransferase class III-fold pyridoxal phosphate-dependent enzyme [Deltaproteobacteria bacterium]MBW2633085.1 aminotransferase class III-fold pyridoxal phosphate-dependent enzyme [Deltaproteobacteria bacterium]MBW2676699.1 aminotransferase class III-fold pyridoxal phosphate-dependent enzyme [Deltaproteobacteria bacterium]
MCPEHLNRNLPQFALNQVKRIVSDLYYIDGDYKELNCERDISYRIRTKSGTAYVVKISNAVEPEGVIDFQIKALKHIVEQDSDLQVPHIIHTKDDKPFDWVQSESGDRHIIRMLTYIEGDVMDRTPAAFNPKTRYNIGAMVGRLTKSLRNFYHPYAGRNVHLWDMNRCLELRPYIQYLPDTPTRELCNTILDRAERFILPQLKKTRWQVVHHDAHPDNVLVDPEDPTRAVGMIDFGDMLYGPAVADLVAAGDSFDDDNTDPLDALCSTAAGFDSSFPLEENEIDLVYDMMLICLLINTVIIGARDRLSDGSEKVHIENTGINARMLKRLWGVGREKAIRRLRRACRFPVYSARKEGDQVFPDRTNELLSKRVDNLGDVWYFYEKPLNFTRSEGPWLYTADGTAYLDAYNNVQQMGHANPHISSAIARQAAAINVNTRYICDIVADYAAHLTAELPDHLNACFFVNSGSEANDVAMQMAKFATGNIGALIMEDAYHGITETTMRLSPEILEPPDNVECLQVPDMYRGPFANDPDAAEKYAADADRAIADLARRGYKPAVFMVDTALCSNGVLMAPDNYFNLVAQKVKRVGGMVVADEVQTGLGRLGNMWGFKARGLGYVDIVTMGKPVANGFPVGIVITSRELLNRFSNAIDLFSTFGGNPVACAAGMALLDEIKRRDLVNKSNALGDYFRHHLHKLADRQSLIGDVRGEGMMIGLEFVTNRENKAPASEQTSRLIELMKQECVLVSEAGPKNVLKIRPNFSWEREHVDLFITTLDRCLSKL